MSLRFRSFIKQDILSRLQLVLVCIMRCATSVVSRQLTILQYSLLFKIYKVIVTIFDMKHI